MASHAEQAAVQRRIVAAYRPGANYAAIAREVGLSPQRVSQILAAHGVPPRRAGRPALDVPERDRAVFAKARRHFGARYARDVFGVEPSA